MNGVEHTFPLPETVAEKLDKVEDELKHQPLALKARDFVRANPWQVITASALAGLLIGMSLRRALP